MKKLLVALFVLVCSNLLAQVEGMRYQAVIIDPNPIEIPGQDLSGTILPNKDIQVRFSIQDASGNVEYSETQNTRTDAYGFIDLIIGQGSPIKGRLNRLVWDGNRKDLKVDIAIDGSMQELSSQELLYIPYAFHRDIIVTLDLKVDGITELKDNLEVNGVTRLQDSVSVNNQSQTNLTGALFTFGETTLNNELNVNDQSNTGLTGTLSVDKATELSDNLKVAGATSLNNTLSVAEKAFLLNNLSVNNQTPTRLSGDAYVDGEAGLNSNTEITNDSNLTVTGALTIVGATVFDGNFNVNGETDLNQDLTVTNGTPSLLSGALTVDGGVELMEELEVMGVTDLESPLTVNNASDSALTGLLTVDGTTNLNDALSVNNGSPTVFSGMVSVAGATEFDGDLTVTGATNLNDNLFVNNASTSTLTGDTYILGDTNIDGTLSVTGAASLGTELLVTNASPTNLTGALTVESPTNLNSSISVENNAATSLSGTLQVDGETTINSSLDVAGMSATQFTGTVEVDEQATLQNTLTVTNVNPTLFSGTLNVDDKALLNNSLEVVNNSSTQLSGGLRVAGESTLNSNLNVNNASPTSLTGTLTVDGSTNLKAMTTINGATTLENTFTVTGEATLGSFDANNIEIEGSVDGYVATFNNTNNSDGANSGDGILIKLGRTHGAWTGSAFLNQQFNINPINQRAYDIIGGRMMNPNSAPNLVDLSLIFGLVPNSQKAAAAVSITNLITGAMNDKLSLPQSIPAVTIPAQRISNELVLFGGTGEVCTGQYCFDPCGIFSCEICIPPVAFCLPSIPRIAFPAVNLPSIPITPRLSNIIPSIPNIPLPTATPIIAPTQLLTGVVPNSLTKENEYITFQDKAGRDTGWIRAQSTQNFRENTILDNVYVVNVASNFMGVDLIEGLSQGSVAMRNLVEEFNKIGVEYASGNGDYAEWLERKNPAEQLSAGDIVGVIGGKISKNLTGAEQVMVVSHRPIIQGAIPEDKEVSLGNTVAFIGQVPVKVIGEVHSGDYIVAHPTIQGYGVAVSPLNMTSVDFTMTVGRSWDDNHSEGMKVVNTVVGLQNGDWSRQVEAIEKDQAQFDAKISSLEEKLLQIEMDLNAVDNTSNSYAEKND